MVLQFVHKNTFNELIVQVCAVWVIVSFLGYIDRYPMESCDIDILSCEDGSLVDCVEIASTHLTLLESVGSGPGRWVGHCGRAIQGNIQDALAQLKCQEYCETVSQLIDVLEYICLPMARQYSSCRWYPTTTDGQVQCALGDDRGIALDALPHPILTHVDVILDAHLTHPTPLCVLQNFVHKVPSNSNDAFEIGLLAGVRQVYKLWKDINPETGGNEFDEAMERLMKKYVECVARWIRRVAQTDCNYRQIRITQHAMKVCRPVYW